jgi:outer membrane protein OmpA-like peptidoglycan-associated protein
MAANSLAKHMRKPGEMADDWLHSLAQAIGRSSELVANSVSRMIPLLVIGTMFLGVYWCVKGLRGESQPEPTVIVMPSRSDGNQPITVPNQLFDFDRPNLTNEGKEEVRKIADRIATLGPVDVLIVGHTDRLGTANYNDALAAKRAQFVRGELASKLARQAMVAVGVGSLFPLTKSEECPGLPVDPGVRDCLAKDRRVEIWLRPSQPR